MSAKVLDGRYKLIKQIGTGGFGHTFIARDMRRPGSPPCVVKQLKPASDDPTFIREARRLFNTEAETLEKLGKHDQIPQLLAYFEEDKQFFLVQEFIEGKSLYRQLQDSLPEISALDSNNQERVFKGLEHIDEPTRDKQLSELEVLKILQDVLDVLEFVHSEGVIHRDIKPDNLICRKQDQKIVLIDFGAVRAMQDDHSQINTENGESRFTVSIGTPGYMPSEQCAGRPTYSSDIYALGMVAIKALTGYAPTDLPSDPSTGEIIWRDKAKVSNGLAMVLTRMIRYHYTQRYQSVREVKQGIATFATMNEVERQATTSKIVSTGNADKSAYSLDKPRFDYSSSSPRGSEPDSAGPSSNSGVLFLFGGLLTAVAVISALVLPLMIRNNQPTVIVKNSPPISISTPTDYVPSPVAAANVPVNQLVNLQVNQDALTIPNNIVGNAIHTYTIQAKSGQVLSASIAGNGLIFTVLNEQSFALSNAVNVVSADIPIGVDGAYVVQVKGVGNASGNPNGEAYQLKLGLKGTESTSTNPQTNLQTNPLSTATTAPAPTAAGTATSPSPLATPTEVVPSIEIKVRNR